MYTAGGYDSGEIEKVNCFNERHIENAVQKYELQMLRCSTCLDMKWPLHVPEIDTMKVESLCTMERKQMKTLQNFKQDMHSSGTCTVPRLDLFRNNMNVRLPHAFPGRNTIGTEGDETGKLVEGSIGAMVRLHRSVEIVENALQ